ncbi:MULTISPECIES: tetratricopeptide repeat protein [Psychrobacter]|uniref:tetratricopeptide repeat protein n=1 Tax=Psychrobacter TaxID=497 RepID=UPI00146B9BB0|nr:MULTISPECIES: tetratricopeptide repeat protein [Psychrobacter]
MPALPQSQAKTALDYVAEGYWQDFVAKRPVAGGMAYEAELQSCQLDESLASLQRVDTLISNIRRDLLKTAALNESRILSDERYRSLLLFLAFYSGRVVTQALGAPLHWYNAFDIKSHAPNLTLASDDFYQQMALGMNNHLFFALEPIGLRLFGTVDRAFRSVQNQPIASGLYQAVSDLLTQFGQTEINPQNFQTKINPSLPKNTLTMPSSLNGLLNKDSQPQTEAQSVAALPSQNNSEIYSNVIHPNVIHPNVIHPNIIQDKTTSSQANESAVNEAPAQSSPVLPTENIVNPPIKNPVVKKVAPTPEIFTQLLTELDTIDVPQRSEVDDYQKAVKILDQFEHHITKQNKPRAEVRFSEANLTARHQALTLLERSADMGNTAAMLRLAMYELLGEGLIADKEKRTAQALALITNAADSDSRAQRLLSRLYYQGLFVAQDLALGKFWLEKAAENGHPEAIDLTRQWQQSELLINSQKQENHSIKRYQLFFAVLVVAAILLVIFL